MTVVLVKRDPNIGNKRHGSLGMNYARELNAFWRVYTDNPSDGPEIVLANPGLPQRGDVYVDANGNSDAFTICQRLTCTEDDDPQKWLVEVLYTSDATEIGREAINPLLEAPKIQWGTECTQEYLGVDLDGVPIQSSAGENYPAGVAKERRLRTLKLTRNEPFFNDAQADEYQDTVNQVAIWGRAIGMVWLHEINGPDAHEFRGGIQFSAVTYFFKMNTPVLDPTTGKVLNRFDNHSLLDAGLMQLGPAGKRVPILEGATPVTTMRALDGTGHVLNVRTVTDAATFGVNNVSSATAAFNAGDVGATITIQAANLNGQYQGVIVFVNNATQVVVDPPFDLILAGLTCDIYKPASYIFPRIYELKDWRPLGLPALL